MLRSVVVCVLLSVVIPAMAEPNQVSGRNIKELVSDAHVEIDVPLGNKIQVIFSADGKMRGSARHLAGYLGAPNDQGRWWVAGDQLCSQWQLWLHGEKQCLRLSSDGTRIHWVNDDGRVGTANIISKAKPQITNAAVPALTRRVATIHVPGTLAAAEPEQPVAVPLASAASAQVSMSRERSAGLEAPFAAMAKEDTDSANGEPLAAETTRSDRRRGAMASMLAGPLFRVARVDASDVLFVREGPSADHMALGVLMPDAHDIRMTGDCRARWCPVAHHEISGWVNRAYLEPVGAALGDRAVTRVAHSYRDPAYAPRSCLSAQARALLDTIEAKFGAVHLVSTCRRGATIAGTRRPSRHASGNAIDFDAGERKAAIVAWLAANHRTGGTMTYGDMNHIHADIGHHFVSLAARDRAGVQAAASRDWSQSRMSLSAR